VVAGVADMAAVNPAFAIARDGAASLTIDAGGGRRFTFTAEPDHRRVALSTPKYTDVRYVQDATRPGEWMARLLLVRELVSHCKGIPSF
jgi:hypothetical protein